MSRYVRTPWASPAGSVAIPVVPVVPVVPAVPDPRWWVAPLAGTLLAPVLAVAVSGTENIFAGSRFLLAGSLVLSSALILPSWFMARTRTGREKRIGLAVTGCALAAGFPAMVATFGWVLFFVMLLTGNVNG